MKFKTAYLYAIGEKQDLKNCLVCGKLLYYGQRKFCSKFHANQLLQQPTKARNQEVVALLETGSYTLADIGLRYNLSRERIRQIYLRATGYGFIKHRHIIWAQKKEVREKAKYIKDNSLKFNCRACQTPVLYKHGYHLSKLCRKCSDLLRKERRNVYLIKTCVVCKKPFHPFSNTTSPSQKKVTRVYIATWNAILLLKNYTQYRLLNALKKAGLIK